MSIKFHLPSFTDHFRFNMVFLSMMENCKDNVIKLPKGKLAVINGLEGFIVAEKDNVLLICKKSDTSGLMRKYVNEAQLKYGEEYV